MKTVLLFGASITHGVGGPQGGWADKIKQSLYRDMYGEDAAGQVCEVYELGVPGASASDLLDRMELEINARVKPGSKDDTCIVIQAGTMDARAVDEPDNFVTAPESLRSTFDALLAVAQGYSSHVFVLGPVPVDERKTNPKHNPITNTYSYFTNDRIVVFEKQMAEATSAAGATFIPLYAQAPDNWPDSCLYTDGMHPNDVGHKWICTQIEPALRKAIGDLA